MTTSRITNKLLEKHQNKEIVPTKSIFGFASFDCEKKNAHIRQKTQEAIDDDNLPGMSFRYLQNTQGRQSTSIEAVLATMLLISTIVRAINDYDSNEITKPSECFGTLLMFAYCIFTLIPNVNNMINYHQTKKKCEHWLENKLRKEDFDHIKKMKYSKKDLCALNQFFNETRQGSIPEKMLNKKNSHCFASDILLLTVGLVCPDIIKPFILLSFINVFQLTVVPAAHHAYPSRRM